MIGYCMSQQCHAHGSACARDDRVPGACVTRLSPHDQVALGAHTAEARATEEFYSDTKFSVAMTWNSHVAKMPRAQ